jgi:hypothetical protein
MFKMPPSSSSAGPIGHHEQPASSKTSFPLTHQISAALVKTPVMVGWGVYRGQKIGKVVMGGREMIVVYIELGI